MKKQQQQKQQQQKLFFSSFWQYLGFGGCFFRLKLKLTFLGQVALRGCQLFKHLWGKLSWMAVSFSSISGTSYPAWLWAFQAALGEPILLWDILHGCALFKHLWDWMAVKHFWCSLSCELFMHLWDILSCMAGRTKGLIKIAYIPWKFNFQRDT